jgi:hypothetical protein
MRIGSVFGSPFQGLGDLSPAFPGRCPGLGWVAPLALKRGIDHAESDAGRDLRSVREWMEDLERAGRAQRLQGRFAELRRPELLATRPHPNPNPRGRERE